mmetsp:Transcript_95265/g.269262  ORF Transcript_95265/g.269262 Transcript_95265/m.269262 type:complete len:104 (+) Transcript_95265:58-369(+)
MSSSPIGFELRSPEALPGAENATVGLGYADGLRQLQRMPFAKQLAGPRRTTPEHKFAPLSSKFCNSKSWTGSSGNTSESPSTRVNLTVGCVEAVALWGASSWP